MSKDDKRITSIEAAYNILHESKRPMKPKEIIEIATREYGLSMRGKTPDFTLSSNFINEIKRRRKSGQPQRFAKIKIGCWGLVEYIGVHYIVEEEITQPGE